jgi:hypothetical protein
MAQSSTSIGPSDGVCVCVPLANYTPQNWEITEFDPLDQKTERKRRKTKKERADKIPNRPPNDFSIIFFFFWGFSLSLSPFMNAFIYNLPKENRNGFLSDNSYISRAVSQNIPSPS